jgi:AraC-like DNA-binding protein
VPEPTAPIEIDPPFQRFRANLVDTAFAPHRHDTYTLALTLHGVQSFDYRGETRHSQPGGVVVLHPDELHDGRPGTEDGFGYAAITLRPDWLVRVRPGKGLPFLPGGLSRETGLVRAVKALHALPDTASPLETESALIDLAQALDALCDAPAPVQRFVRDQVDFACGLIEAHLEDGISLATLEQETGLDRWQLCRAFRAVRGTSPGRYLTLRRLDRVRAGVLSGDRLADAAMDAGFADQAHMTRQFKAAYGISPGQWRRTIIQDPIGRLDHTRLH